MSEITLGELWKEIGLVKVIYCKDCEYYDDYLMPGTSIVFMNLKCCTKYDSFTKFVTDYDYCSKAKRRETENEL